MEGDAAHATWGLLVSQYRSRGYYLWFTSTLGHVTGTRDEALRALYQHAVHYRPQHPQEPQRRWVYEQDDGYLAVVEGLTQTFHCRFTLAKLLHDSAPPPPPTAPPAPPEPPTAPPPPPPPPGPPPGPAGGPPGPGASA